MGVDRLPNNIINQPKMLSLIATWAIVWMTSTYELRDKMVKNGMSTEISTQLINECKKQVWQKQSALKCVYAGFAIAMNETNGCKFAYKFSCFWVQKAYNSHKESIKGWVKTYFDHWYKWKDWSHFYWSPKKKAPTRYCTEEKSSGSVGWCKNWREHFDFFIAKLK